jgi:hypothetical protein
MARIATAPLAERANSSAESQKPVPVGNLIRLVREAESRDAFVS